MTNSSKYSFYLKVCGAIGLFLTFTILFVLNSNHLFLFNKKQDDPQVQDSLQVDFTRQLPSPKSNQTDRENLFGSVELLKVELDESLSYPFRVNIIEKELSIKIFFEENDLSDLTNDKVKRVITNIFSAMHKSKYDQYDNVTVSIVAPLTVQTKDNSQMNIVNARYSEPVVTYIPWHEIKHVDMYHIADKLNLHPKLR